jgi:hypothetical protein
MSSLIMGWMLFCAAVYITFKGIVSGDVAALLFLFNWKDMKLLIEPDLSFFLIWHCQY